LREKEVAFMLKMSIVLHNKKTLLSNSFQIIASDQG